MKTLGCRVGGDWEHPAIRRKPIVARRGRLCIVREPGGRYSIMHMPTGLGVHPNLMDLRLRPARTALVLCAVLDQFDWTDPEFIRSMDWRYKWPFYEALLTIYRMAME